MNLYIWLVIAYLIGSIPFGLIIGKLFFQVDIREHGSGNSGGTNAGRVLGLRIGLLVILCDGLKALLAMILSHIYNPGIEQYVGLSVCVGHCFPIFAKFKGGKAVASAYGYLLGLAMYVTHEFIYTYIGPLLVFIIVLLISKMVSLSSMIGVTSASIFISIIDYRTAILVLCLALLVIYRHGSNIKRIISGTESKISI